MTSELADPGPEIQQLCDRAFGQGRVTVGTVEDVNRGRGAFSIVLRARLEPNPDVGSDAASMPGPPGSEARSGPPDHVVAKLPVTGANRQAAVTSGAYGREALAYRELLVDSPVAVPRVHLVDEPGDGTCSLLLQDLTGFRAVDQLDGLSSDDARLVAETLARLHRHWPDDGALASLPVRRNTVAALPVDRLQTGLACLKTVWGDLLDQNQRNHFARLLSVADRLAARFDELTPTLCHGDPRADNLVFDPDRSEVVLFDWQQMAVQFGEADVAWLAATSLDVKSRRSGEAALVEAYGGDMDRYRIGMALPGLSVLLLAQRELATDRTRRFVATSLTRIAAAIADLEVADIN